MKKILALIVAALTFAGCIRIEQPEQKKTVCDFTYQVDGLTVSFTNESTTDLLFNHWEFGDGAKTTAENATHTYSKACNYTVTMVCYSGSTKFTCIKTISVGGGGGSSDPQDTEKDVYVTGFKVYKLPNSGYYKFNCTFNGFIAQSVEINTNSTYIMVNDLPRTIKLNTPKNIGKENAFIVNYSGIFLDILYNKYDAAYDHSKIYSGTFDTMYLQDEFIFTNSQNTVKVGVLTETR